MYGHTDGIEQIQRENTDDGFGINDISAAGKVNLVGAKGDDVYEIAYVFNGGKFDLKYLPSGILLNKIIQ